MKKLALVMSILMVMLSTMGFTSVDKAYFEETKKVMQWKALEATSNLTLDFSTIDGEKLSYEMDIIQKGMPGEMLAYIEINTKAKGDSPEIPQIKLYIKGSDVYINKEAMLAFIKATTDKDVEINEEFILMKSEQNVQITASLMDELMAFVELIAEDIELGMVNDGNKYTLNLNSDELVELLDAYFKAVINNIDKMPTSFLPEDLKITEEEKAQVLAMYDAFVTPYKDTIKETIKGSTLSTTEMFEEAKYSQEMALDIKSEYINGKIVLKSVSNKVENMNITLPTSVKEMTQEELNELMMPPMPPSPLMISLDGSYMNFKTGEMTQGKIDIKNIDGKTYLNVNQLSSALSIMIEYNEEYIRTTDLNNMGFSVQWNPETNTIDIY